MNRNKVLLKNVSRTPEVYYCKHIEKGVVNYEVSDKTVTVLIDEEALNKMDATFQGRGVFVHHQDVALDELQEKADGYVVESFYNKLDGWHWAKFLIISDEGHQAINQGWSVSNCYVATEFGESGVYHNINFDQKVLSGVYEHLAIVPNPRYEGAKIFTSEEFKQYNSNLKNELESLRNSKDQKTNGGKVMFNLFKKEKIENAIDLENAVVQCEDGEEIILKDAIEFMKNSKKKNEEGKEKEKEEFEISMESEIDVDGESMKVKDLVNAYRSAKKKNAEDEEAKKKEEEKKENEAEEEAKKEEEKKENALKEKAKIDQEEFDKIKNSIHKNQVDGDEVKFETMLDRLENGKKKY